MHARLQQRRRLRKSLRLQHLVDAHAAKTAEAEISGLIAFHRSTMTDINRADALRSERMHPRPLTNQKLAYVSA